jgi:spore germination protein GerM
MTQFIKRFFPFIVVIIFLVGIFVNFFLQAIVNDYQSGRFSKGDSQAKSNLAEVVIYFYKKDTGSCDNITAIKRQIENNDLYSNALKELFKGPTENERLFTSLESSFGGYDSVFNSVVVKNNLANVDFKGEIIDPNSKYYKNFAKSCDFAKLNQISFTLKQFSSVKKVVYSIDGSPKKFISAKGIDCSNETINQSYQDECKEQI